MPKIEPREAGAAELLFSRVRQEEPWHEPTKTYAGDSGLDLYVSTFTPVYPGVWARIPHNLAICPPLNKYGLIVPRSSTVANKGIIILPGVIDSGYRGEIMTVCFNPGRKIVMLNAGERVSQLLILPLYRFDCREVALVELPDSERGSRGFGGSGV